MKLASSNLNKKGYTLIEVLVAASLLGVLLGGAVKAVATMNIAEDTSRTGNVALNLTETAAALWQFGLTPAEVQAIMPVSTNNEFINRATVADASGNAVRFPNASTTVTLPNTMGSVESIDVVSFIEDPTTDTKYRTITINVLRD